VIFTTQQSVAAFMAFPAEASKILQLAGYSLLPCCYSPVLKQHSWMPCYSVFR